MSVELKTKTHKTRNFYSFIAAFYHLRPCTYIIMVHCMHPLFAVYHCWILWSVIDAAGGEGTKAGGSDAPILIAERPIKRQRPTCHHWVLFMVCLVCRLWLCHICDVWWSVTSGVENLPEEEKTFDAFCYDNVTQSHPLQMAEKENQDWVSWK